MINKRWKTKTKHYSVPIKFDKETQHSMFLDKSLQEPAPVPALTLYSLRKRGFIRCCYHSPSRSPVQASCNPQFSKVSQMPLELRHPLQECLRETTYCFPEDLSHRSTNFIDSDCSLIMHLCHPYLGKQMDPAESS